MMLEKEFTYYINHQSELVKKYKGKFIVIIGNKILGNYNTFEQALIESEKLYPIGSFLIQECFEGEENYTQTFHSRVVFK